MRDERTERAYGPYKHGQRFRVIVVGSDGRRRRRSFASHARAAAYIDRFAVATDTRTVSAAVDEYIAHLRKRGLRDGSVATVAFRLRALLRTTDRDRSMRILTGPAARDLYERRCAEIAPETQRQELGVASAFASWCVKQGWIRADPFAAIEATRARAPQAPAPDRRGSEVPRHGARGGQPERARSLDRSDDGAAGNRGCRSGRSRRR